MKVWAGQTVGNKESSRMQRFMFESLSFAYQLSVDLPVHLLAF
jgi:hypothetical protein